MKDNSTKTLGENNSMVIFPKQNKKGEGSGQKKVLKLKRG
jgi:hypothetical protein